MALFKNKSGVPGTLTIGKKKEVVETQISDDDLKLNSLNRSIRIIEDRYNALRKQVQYMDEQMLKNKQKLNTEIKAADDEVYGVNSEIMKLREKIDELTKEIHNSARAEDLQVLSKYVDLFSPVTFVTREEAKKMIKDAKGI